MKKKKFAAGSLLLLGLACFGTITGVQANSLYSSCYGCHGPEGVSVGQHMPSISGLNFQYFYSIMRDYRKDKRPATIMNRIAKGYKSGQLQRMALYFGRRPWIGNPGDADPELAQRGMLLHEKYCEKCHEDYGRFQDREVPPLAGQAKGYLYLQMKALRKDDKDSRSSMMQTRLKKLSEDQLLALAEFYVSDLAQPQTETAAE